MIWYLLEGWVLKRMSIRRIRSSGLEKHNKRKQLLRGEALRMNNKFDVGLDVKRSSCKKKKSIEQLHLLNKL
jgi:hypothetical protein